MARWPLLIRFGLLVVTAGVAPAHAQLRAHWRFDEASGTTAVDTASGFNGTLTNGAHFEPAAGIAGGAMRITRASNDYVTMGDVLAFGRPDAFSIQIWVKLAPGDTTNYIVAGRHHAGFVNGYFLATSAGAGYGQPGHAWFYASVQPGHEADSTTLVNDGQWHQVVGVYTPGGCSIFVDGAPFEGGAPAILDAVPAVFVVGGVWTGSAATNLFDGWVDDIQVYCSVLTDTQIQYLFDHPGSEVPRCPSNWNRDCRIDSQDFFDFLSDFFADHADINGDNVTNSQDFFDFLGAFFSGC